MTSGSYTPRELADDNWQDADRVWTESNKSLNNIVLIVGTGSFVLSVSFMTGIKTDLNAGIILAASWFFLLFSIFSNILLQVFYMKWGEAIKKYLNQAMESGEINNPNFNVNDVPVINNLCKRQDQTLRITLYFLMAGVFALFLFGLFNISSW